MSSSSFDFCSAYSSRCSPEHDHAMRFSCAACGKQGLCQACANVSNCSKCGNGCCQDCSTNTLPCCGKVLCGSGGSKSETQSCFGQHRNTTTSLPCGHYGCNFSSDCHSCKLQSELDVKQPAATKPVTKAKKKKPSWKLRAAKQETTLSSSQATSTFNAPMARKRPALQESRPKRVRRSVYQAEPMEQEAPVMETTAAMPTTTKLSSLTAKPSSFPHKLFQMVTETAQVAPDVIRWIEKGEAFVVHNDPKSRKLERVLQAHFHHNKYTSLQRQLNIYGFKKFTKGKYKGAFHHSSFHRDRPQDVSQIRRRPPPHPAESNRVAAAAPPTKSKRRRRQTQTANKSLVVDPPEIQQQQPQVLSPNKRIPKKKTTIAHKHLPPKKRIYPRNDIDVENVPTSCSPIVNEVKEKFKSVAGKRPTLVWSTW